MKKVLLVEDDPFIRDITSIKLSERGYAVVAAHSGTEALQKVKEEKPDAVLLDLDLPDIPGLNVMKSLKADEATKNTPVVIFSNNDEPATLKEAEELGASAFFVKAVTSFEDLHQKLQQLSE